MESKRIIIDHELPKVFLKASADVVVPKTGAHYIIVHQEAEVIYRFFLKERESIAQIEASIKTSLTPSLRIEIIHEASHTSAETLVKTLATENAKPRFEGIIKIGPKATQTESFLNHHSLVFDQAQSYSWPALEILNNQVACSHAATIKTITPLDIFYLQSRGLTSQAAQEILVDTFFAEMTKPHA